MTRLNVLLQPDANARMWILPLLLVMLTGCGFTLRGQAQLPPAMAKTYIRDVRPVGAPPSALANTLRQFLASSGVEVVNDPQAATAMLEIFNEGTRRRTLAAGPEGDFREYTFTYSVNFRATATDTKTVLSDGNITKFRDVIYAESDVLGKQEGEQIALQEMQADAAQTIIRRLEVANQSDETPP
jgi:LPS-assembly lipoprotein